MPPPPPEPPGASHGAVEAIVLPPLEALAIRPRHVVWVYVRVIVFEFSVEQLNVSKYLNFKEELVNGKYDMSL